MKKFIFILFIPIIAFFSISAVKKIAQNNALQNKYKDFSIIDYQLEGRKYKLLTADTPQKWEKGLMHFRSLEGVDGMIFIFSDKEIRNFWNKNTFMDLELLWVDGEKVVGKSKLPSIEKSKNIINVESPKPVDKVIELPKKFASEELSDKEYEEVKKEFLNMLHTSDPKKVFERLRNEINTDESLLRSCHALVHEIGRNSYEKYQDFAEAIKYQDEICNSGYMHGVIEAHFSTSEDIFSDMKTLCDRYRLGSFFSWECYHGIGHGLMYYTANDLPRSLKMCESLKGDFAQSNCVNGAFMENFNADQKLHLSKFLKNDDLFFPCQEQEEKYKAFCYIYTPTHYLNLNKNDYLGTLKWCQTAEVNHRETCAAGVGSQAIKENINNPKFVEEICMSGDKTQMSSCIGGMVGLYINHFGSLEPAKKLCERLEKVNEPVCQNAVTSSSELFL